MSEQQPVVIVGDPQDGNIAYYSEVIQGLGARCLSTRDGANLMELVVTHQPALVLLDSQLKEPDSYQLLNLLGSGNKTRQIPVLFVMGNLSERKVSLYPGLFTGVEVLCKPLVESRLQRLLQDYLKQYRYRLAIEKLAEKASTQSKDPDTAARDGVLAVDERGQILFANHEAERILKAGSVQLAGVFLESLFEPHCETVRSRWKEHPVYRVTSGQQILQVDNSTLWRADGSAIQVKFAAVPLDGLDNIKLVFAFKQIKDTRESKDKLSRLSQVDHLTNLPLRAALEDGIDRNLVKARLSGFYFGLLCVDLDHFRYINESLGHDRGDQLIKAVAKRILELVRRDDLVGRMEGDEFVVVLSHVDLPENAGMVAGKIIERLREPFLIDGHEVYTGCTIGVAVYPTCGDDAASLLKNAESALVRAKSIGRNSYQYFTAEMNKLRLEQMQMEFELHQAVEQRQWRIQYLPVVTSAGGDVVACEVKLSWTHPKRGEIELDTFLPVAEEAGLASDIFRWLWGEVLQRFNPLALDAKEKLRLVLPMSPAILLQEGGVDWVITTIANAGLDSDQIYLELPETYYTVRLGQHGDVLNELCRNGFNLILDSFGTGFAPLSLLKDVPYSLVKLSDTFVSVCDISKSDQALIKGVIDMAHQLGIQVMAAAVDSDAQAAFLKSVSCDWLAGEAVGRELDRSPQKLDVMGLNLMPG